jgi:hypothetical protein
MVNHFFVINSGKYAIGSKFSNHHAKEVEQRNKQKVFYKKYKFVFELKKEEQF